MAITPVIGTIHIPKSCSPCEMGTSPFLFESVLFEPYPRSIRGLRYPLPDQLPQVEAAQRDRWLRDAERRAGTRLATAVDELVGGPEADGLLGSLVTKHGVFVSRFFGRAIMPVVTAALARHPNSVVDLFRLFASELRGEPFQPAEWWEGAEPSQSVVENCMEEFLYDQALYRLVTTQVGLDAMRSWFNEASNPRHCVVCSSQKPFRVVDMAEWFYANAGGYMHCCFQCGLLEKPKKAALHALVPEFIAACGFIPPANSTMLTPAFTLRLDHQRWPGVARAFQRMGGIDHVRKKFGSWFDALADTGALPDGVWKTSRGIRCRAQDGHECHSLAEQQIDDWLRSHNIVHEREPYYPDHAELNPHGGRRADWGVTDVFIEYFGLAGDPVYDRKLKEKVRLAGATGLELVPLFPEDLLSLDTKLSRFIR